MIPVKVIRPQPGCDATVEAAREAGLDASGHPLFELQDLPWETVPPEDVDALLIGSANAIRHGGAAIAAYAGKPAYAVGATTAQVAREAGLEVVAIGELGLQDLLGAVRPEHKRLLRIAGQQRVQVDPPEGTKLIERIAYSSNPLPIPGDLAAALRQPAIVLLHSAEAARHFALSCQGKAIDQTRISIAGLSPRIAEAVGTGWAEVRGAETPEDSALLALASEMCEKRGSADDNMKVAMQDETIIRAHPTKQPPRRTGRGQVLAALLAFLLGAALVGWLGWQGYFDVFTRSDSEQQLATAGEGAPTPEIDLAGRLAADDSEATDVGTVEARIAMLEDRLSRLNLQANAASGNAARAESLLIAFAARRMVDRGEPLRYLADQLRLRFANAQPRAVKTIVDFGEDPVTIDELSARLEALRPQLTRGSDDESFWESAKRELGGIFTVRTEPSALLSPEARIERAGVMLTAGKIEEAVDLVARLPGVEAAGQWIIDAQRYAAAQEALDLIETTAMLEPSKLKDSEGNRVYQPSPLATPTATKKPAS